MGPNRIILAAVTLALGFAAAPASAEWRASTPLPAPWFLSRTVSNGTFIYNISGLSFDEGVCGSKKVLVARVNPDETVGPWTTTTPLPALSPVNPDSPGCDLFVRSFGLDAVYASSHVYVIGGLIVPTTLGPPSYWSNAVYHAEVSSDGTLGEWNATTPLPIGIGYHAAAVWEGTIYVTGGCTRTQIDDPNTDICIPNSYFSRINPDGSLGPWQTGTPLPAPEGGTQVHAAVATNGYLYISGGSPWYSPQGLTNAVYRAPLNSDGSIGTWQAATPLPKPVGMHGMVERHGILYVMGGFEEFGPVKSVYSVPINQDGSLSNWSIGDSLPNALYGHASVVNKDALYILGGSDFVNMQSSVYYNPERTPPAPIADLSVQAVNSRSIQLNWTATGNDGAYGRVENGQYDIRYSVNASDFSSFDTIPDSIAIPANFEPGDAQSALLAALPPGTQYYVAVKTIDRAGNRSDASNVSSAMTYYLATSTETPARMKLESVYPSFSIQIVPEQQAALALQTAPGALVSSIYEIAPSGTNLTPPGILTFSFDASVDPTKVSIYKYIDSTVGWSSASITAQVVDSANLTITGRLPSTSMYALFTSKKSKPAETAAFKIFISPGTLNLKSNGKWITAYLESADGTANISDIDPKTIRLTRVNDSPVGPIYASGKSSIGDGNSNGIPDLGVKFDRGVIQAVLTAGQATLRFDGATRSGLAFNGNTTLRVIAPPMSSVGAHAKANVQPVPARLRKVLEYPRSAKPFVLKDFISILTSDDSAAFTTQVRKITGPKRIVVAIPNDAAAPDLAVTVSTNVPESSLDGISRKIAAGQKKLIAVAAPVEFGPEGTQFSKPVTLELPYDRAALPPGLDESALTVQYWNPGAGKWETMPSSVDKQAQVVRAQTSHFSLYQIFGGGSAASAPASPNDPTFAVHAGYAFPNPSRNGTPVVIRVQPGLADSVSVRVYDLSGRMVHESSNFTNRGGVDDGNGFGSQFTFEHTWDVSGVGSGVYNFVVTGRKAGAGDIKATGKVGVIK